MRKAKIKKPYRSLSSIYLSEAFAKPVPGAPYSQVATPQQPEQQPVTQQPVVKKQKQKEASACAGLAKPNIEIAPGKEFTQIQNSPVVNKAWTPFQQQIFNWQKTGTGRGEFSVASFVSGIVSSSAIAAEEVKCLLDDCIQGQSKSFDVCVPPETEEYKSKQKLKFEVKELDVDGASVRIGAEGQKATSLIVNGVLRIIERLENSYHSLDRNSKLQVDDLLRRQLELTKGGPPAKPFKETKANLAKYGKQQQMFEFGQGWNLGGFLSAIYQSEDTDNKTIRELPSNLIKKEGTMDPSRYSKNPLRARYFLRTLQEVFNAIEEIAKDQTAFTVNVTNKSQELKDIIRKMYLPEIETPEQKQKEEEFLDDIVDDLDRKLTRRKITTTGKGHLTAKDFFNSVNNLKLLSELRRVQDMFNDAAIIRNLFPKDITGVFLVSANQFSYFPQDQISNYIEIDQISSGGVKIAVKKQQATV